MIGRVLWGLGGHLHINIGRGKGKRGEGMNLGG